MKIYANRGRHRIITGSTDVDNAINILEDYLPNQGEGNTLASQIATAVNRLMYKWYNDGDVYDNTSWYWVDGFNNVSSYANWLYKYVPETRKILDRVFRISDTKEYEDILDDLLLAVSDAEDLENWHKQRKKGTIYDCDGPYHFEELDIDEEDEW